MELEPLDVWLRFDEPEREEPDYEANTFRDGDVFRVDWYHVDVGQVTSRRFPTLKAAQDWLESVGYQDFTA